MADDKTNLPAGDSANVIVVPLSASLKSFVEQQAKSEGVTPAQLLVAAFLRTYNPRSMENPPADRS